MTIKLKSILKELIHEKDITAVHLARSTKVPPQTLNNWLSGQMPRNLDQLKAVADYFQVSLDYLIYGSKSEGELSNSDTHSVRAIGDRMI